VKKILRDKMNDEKRMKLLSDVKKLLDDNDIEFFPIYGTLLGFVREKRIMPWDVDLDFGAWHHDFDKILDLKPEFEKLGYKLAGSGLGAKYCHINICPAESFEYYEDRGSYELTHGADAPFHAGFSFWAKDIDKAVELKFFDNNLFHRMFYKIDGNFIYNSLSTIYTAVTLFRNKHKVLPYSWFENMKTVEVHGLKFKILSNPIQYLSKMYGENWEKPVKEWSKKKHLEYNKLLIKYQIKDKNIRDLWLKRDEKHFQQKR
jgi:phosphorylcholine metabolism protein LicD